MTELYDPSRVLTEDWRTFFVENRHKTFILPCIERDVEIKGAWMLLNIMLCMPLIKRYRQISVKHLMLSGIYGKNSHAKHMTIISKSLEEYGYAREELEHDIIMTVNESLNMCYTHLGSFIRTMDIFSIANTILQDGFRENVQIDYGDISDKNVTRMQNLFDKKCKEVDEYLMSDKLALNIFKAPLLCGAFKKAQFYQCLISGGVRSDTDDHVFFRPIEGSFISGFKNIIDMAIESRAATKSEHYNITQMANTQYVNRKIHIQNAAVRYLYQEDCHSDVYMTYTPNAQTVKFYIGKFYLDDSGNLVELTPDKFESVINKTLKMRDPITCRYTDGYCKVCGGTLTGFFSKTGNVGFLSNVNTGGPAAQQVLVTKHTTSTNINEYEIHQALSDILVSYSNNIYLRRAYHKNLDKLVFGFGINNIAKINDLRYCLNDSDIHAAYFSEIKFLDIGMMMPDGIVKKVLSRTSMGDKTRSYPHLSAELLSVIKKYPSDIVIQKDIAWLKLDHIDVAAPLMQCTVINNSIKLFVSKFTSLVTNEVANYTSANKFMYDLTNLIWDKVNTHITHASCLAKACLITNKKDFSIPIVTNPDSVMFGALNKIIPMRTIGGLFAFERFNVASNKPLLYITPKSHDIFDEFLGYTDLIERDMNFPDFSEKKKIKDVQ